MSISIEQCLDLLPQTQCQECGYHGCRPYAEALVSRQEPSIARCLPGGQDVASALSELLSRPEEQARTIPEPATATIDVADCIGCSLCLKACPVDAIWGAQGFEHQVWESDCTACGLCVPACPTACISIIPRSEGVPFPTAEHNLSQIAAKDRRTSEKRQKKWEAHRHALKKKEPCLVEH